MDNKWTELYNAAKAVQNSREISDRVWAGGVAAAIESFHRTLMHILGGGILSCSTGH